MIRRYHIYSLGDECSFYTKEGALILNIGDYIVTGIDLERMNTWKNSISLKRYLKTMETKETKLIKTALYKRSKELFRHGVQEVTIGHIVGGKGYDRCDYVEFDNDGNFYGYEIKVTVRDLNSNNRLR